MESIISFIQQSFEFIIPLIVLLGALIFVHELGHFLVAKYYGVRVETFSLGFGKKILKYRYGDTTYCISLIPLGGYIKMFGDDPNVEISEEDKKHSFLHKPVGQRIAVVLAGPLMNLVFAFFLFLVIAGIGDQKPLPVIGQVNPSSTAAELGLEAGDRILSVNKKKVRTWQGFEKALNKSTKKRALLEINKASSDEVKQIQAPLIEKANPNPLSWDRKILTINGLESLPVSTQIGVANGSLAEQAGLKIGDQILEINSNEVNRWYELEQAFSNIQKETIFLKVKRGEEVLEISLNKEENSLRGLGIERPDLYVGIVADDSAAANAGLQKHDKILSINNQKITVWSELTGIVEAYSAKDGALDLKVQRGNEVLNFSLSPKKMHTTNPMTGKKESSYKIGIGPVLSMAPPKSGKIYPETTLGYLTTGFSETVFWTNATALGFVRLVQNEVSAKSIGGPIMIGQIASESYKIGINAFLKIMAIISINLFLLNLLPIPVLDGGHLVFFTIEAIKGSPLSLSKLEKAQQFGLFILLFLMVFAIFNDISRVFGMSW